MVVVLSRAVELVVILCEFYTMSDPFHIAHTLLCRNILMSAALMEALSMVIFVWYFFSVFNATLRE